MSWYDSLYDSAMDAVGLGDDDDKKKSDTKTKAKSGEEKEEKSWFDKISWDDVSESVGDLFGGDDDDKSSNANTRQQPNQTVKDNHGNAVTGAALQPKDNTMLYVGGGIAALVAVVGLVLVIKK